jgi:hypothetical protein
MKIGELEQLIEDYKLYHNVTDVQVLVKYNDEELYPVEIVQVKSGDCHTLNLIVEWED